MAAHRGPRGVVGPVGAGTYLCMQENSRNQLIDMPFNEFYRY